MNSTPFCVFSQSTILSESAASRKCEDRLRLGRLLCHDIIEMSSRKSILLALFGFLAFASCVHAQYRWHIVHPDRVATDSGTFYYGFTNISCSGESCSVIGNIWHGQSGDSDFILHSIDGGITWSVVEPPMPQWVYTWNSKGELLLDGMEQIDSLDAIATGGKGTIFRTFDGWNTWQTDSLNFPPVIVGRYDTIAISFTGVDFVNLAEGALYDGPNELDFFTVDSGKTWTERTGDIYPSGPGMFREYLQAKNSNEPDTILTTKDDWTTADTSTFTWNGPFLTGSLIRGAFMVGAGDTLFSLAYRYDSTGVNQIATLVRSTDLGKNWAELPIPRTNRITWTIVSPLDEQTLVVAGRDSTGEILISSDRGTSWVLDTVPLDNGMPYWLISSVAVTSSGRVIASIIQDNSVLGSRVLAYLEPVPSSATPNVPSQANFNLYPNPAINLINIASPAGAISIADPLGRSYAVPRNGNMLDISSLPSGVYFVCDGHSRAKFVKE
jgi:photosystem II stability/assembly factor-like uncharacterized protein